MASSFAFLKLAEVLFGASIYLISISLPSNFPAEGLDESRPHLITLARGAGMPTLDLAAQLGVSRQAIEARAARSKTKMIEVLGGLCPIFIGRSSDALSAPELLLTGSRICR